MQRHLSSSINLQWTLRTSCLENLSRELVHSVLSKWVLAFYHIHSSIMVRFAVKQKVLTLLNDFQTTQWNLDWATVFVSLDVFSLGFPWPKAMTGNIVCEQCSGIQRPAPTCVTVGFSDFSVRIQNNRNKPKVTATCPRESNLLKGPWLRGQTQDQAQGFWFN